MTTELAELGAAKLSTLIARGDVSCVAVMRAHLEQVERCNPVVNALVGCRDGDALLAEARERDAELRRGGPRGPLHGLPHAVKDLAEVAGLPWTQGSPIFADRVGVTDDLFVRRIRDAGAILVGKTNTPEFGYGSQTYNPVWGATRNPYDPDRTVGGSSGGAAAALACRMLPVADGSDYLGSLRNPAAFANVLGLRPSRGRVPVPGFVAQLSETGPMARSVADLRLLLGVMAGPHRSAPLSHVSDMARDRTPYHSPGARIAWIGDLGGRLPTEPGLLDVCRRAGDAFTELGAVVTEVDLPVDLESLWRALLVWRGWAALELGPLYDDPVSRAALKPEAVWEVEQGRRLSLDDVRAAMAVRDAWYDAVVDLFDTYDAVLAPSAQVFPFPVEQAWPAEIDGRPMDSYHRWMETVAPWSMAGTPVLGMPAGFDGRGLPAGVQLVGPPGADARVLELGAVYEEATGWVRRVRPPLLSASTPPPPR